MVTDALCKKKGLDVIKTPEELIKELERVEYEVQIPKGDKK